MSSHTLLDVPPLPVWQEHTVRFSQTQQQFLGPGPGCPEVRGHDVSGQNQGHRIQVCLSQGTSGVQCVSWDQQIPERGSKVLISYDHITHVGTMIDPLAAWAPQKVGVQQGMTSLSCWG